MEKLHHATLKSAVAKYGQLHTDGKSADEIKATIATDEKEFQPAQIDEIYDAIVNPKPDNNEKVNKPVEYIVASEFRDINDFSNVYSVGQSVSHLDSKRIERLLELKLIKEA